MSQKSRNWLSYAAWVFAIVLGAAGMFAANQKQLADAHREAQLAATQHALGVKMQQEAAAKEQETHRFINEFDYPIAMLNHRGEVVEWNAAAEHTFGWTKADLQANGIASIMPEEMRERHHSAFGKAMVGDGKVVGRVNAPVQRVECVVVHKDPARKPIPVEVSVRVIREDDGDVYAIAHIDRQSRILRVDAQETN